MNKDKQLLEARERAVKLMDEIVKSPDGQLHFIYDQIKHLNEQEQTLHIAGFLLYKFKAEFEAAKEFHSTLNSFSIPGDV